MGDWTIPTSVQVVSLPSIRSVTVSPTARSGWSSRMLAVATSALPSSGSSQRPSWTVGRTVCALGGSPNAMTWRPSVPALSTTPVDANRQGSAATTPGTAIASLTRTDVRSVVASSTWTS